MQPVNVFRVVVLGQSSVGKSSVLVRYARGTYSPDRPPTIGAVYFRK